MTACACLRASWVGLLACLLVSGGLAVLAGLPGQHCLGGLVRCLFQNKAKKKKIRPKTR